MEQQEKEVHVIVLLWELNESLVSHGIWHKKNCPLPDSYSMKARLPLTGGVASGKSRHLLTSSVKQGALDPDTFPSSEQHKKIESWVVVPVSKRVHGGLG